MKKEYYEINSKLINAYGSWLKEIKKKTPGLLGDDYSNPYYACIPKNWFEADVRILCVGEEGHGIWGRGKSEGVRADDINRIQQFCWSSLASNLQYELDYELYPDATTYKIIKSPFWNRIRKLSQYGICAWTNIDLIHKRSKDKCCLNEKERYLLHSVDSRILAEQISVLNPTHIVYQGWYGYSLKHELPEIFKILYPNDLGDDSRWKNSVVTIKHGGRSHIFAYHPAWGYRKKGYEEKVISEFEKTLIP